MLDWNRLIPDFGLTAGELADKYTPENGVHGHPQLPISDWKHEVENDTTRLGYWNWLHQELMQLEYELQNDNPFTVDT